MVLLFLYDKTEIYILFLIPDFFLKKILFLVSNVDGSIFSTDFIFPYFTSWQKAKVQLLRNS